MAVPWQAAAAQWSLSTIPDSRAALSAGLTRAAVIKPLNEQIKGLFTKPAPLVALFDQFQNSF